MNKETEVRTTGMRAGTLVSSGETIGEALNGYKDALQSALDYALVLHINGFFQPWISMEDGRKMRLEIRGPQQSF